MHSGRDPNPRLKTFARRMRRESTDAERKLWSLLRNGRLGGYRFRRQTPVQGYIVDFYCIACRLVVELDGGQHSDPAQREYDQERTRALNANKIKVLRFWDCDVLKDPHAVARTIYRELCLAEEPSPQPSPGVPGEGVENS